MPQKVLRLCVGQTIQRPCRLVRPADSYAVRTANGPSFTIKEASIFVHPVMAGHGAVEGMTEGSEFGSANGVGF